MGDWHAASSGLTTSTPGEELLFKSRRSPFLCRKACVASSQPLASSVGVDLLRRGANAADVAVAMAAMLAVTEPCSTGLGGDAFCLFYKESEKKVYAINGSGKSPVNLSMETIADVTEGDFNFSVNAVTVPGAARAWEDTLKEFGSGNFTFEQLLAPAIEHAEEGFPVSPVTAYHWKAGMGHVRKWVHSNASVPMTVDGVSSPKAGEIFRNPDMARVLRDLGSKGASLGFYEGITGEAIVEAIQKNGGVMTMEDLKSHESTFPEPICGSYRGVSLWEVPPNGQGAAAIVALLGLDALEKAGSCPSMGPSNIGSADYFHVLTEMMRLGFADARSEISSPEHSRVPPEWFTQTDRIGKRAVELFDMEKATIQGLPIESSCTVSFQVVDTDGNAISFVNSNYMGFGTGLCPDGCGFTLQNRGAGFRRDDLSHPNRLEGGKRPFHTIIPGMMTYTDTGDFYATITNMGGNMQPQGHLQLTVDLVAGGMDPQAAVDLPRFCILSGTQDGVISFEEGIPEETRKELEKKGHKLKAEVSGHARSIFGRAQIIKRDPKSGVLWAGSDGRADGCAMGF